MNRQEEYRHPLRTVVDLDLGDSRTVALNAGGKVRVEALEVVERQDTLRSALRSVRVRIRVNGVETWIDAGNYNLPRTVGGVRVDCPVTSGYNRLDARGAWALVKDLRLRLWPEDSHLIRPGSLTCPTSQRWFATDTQMANEPCFVGKAEGASADRVYYHDALDIGGAEGMVEVVSATDGTVLTVGMNILEGYPFYGRPCPDQVDVIDERGWVHLYAHLTAIEPGLRPGQHIARGSRIALLGKEGSSGGWAHLHYGVYSLQPSGQWGTEEAYPYLWEAYTRQHDPPLIAVARPHHFIRTGESVGLDATRSWSRYADGIESCEWFFNAGDTARGARVARTYPRAGMYSEILKVTDRHGNVDYDFAVVQVVDEFDRNAWPPGIHAAYAPTLGLTPGKPVTFLVRSFHAGEGKATWNFGDGSPEVSVPSPGNLDPHDPSGYARVEHAYARSGHYIARVDRPGKGGLATAHLHVCVEPTPAQNQALEPEATP